MWSASTAVRDESDNDYGSNYLQAEAIIAKLMHHYNEERLHAALGYMLHLTCQRPFRIATGKTFSGDHRVAAP